jgi:hypothetical protein
MPLYYFDLDDGDAVARDPDGVDLTDLAVARAEAQKALAEMARDLCQTEDERRLACTIRDGDGGVCRVELTMRCLPLH